MFAAASARAPARAAPAAPRQASSRWRPARRPLGVGLAGLPGPSRRLHTKEVRGLAADCCSTEGA